MLRAVLFDLDDTLISRTGAFEACLRESFADRGDRDRLRLLDARGRGCRESLFALWSQLSGEPMSQEILTRRLTPHLPPEPEVIGYVGEARSCYRVAVVSNGGGPTQRSKLSASGLHTVFLPGEVWISAEQGVAKPDPDLPLRACRALEVEPADCLLFGDSDDEDGLAARAAGIPFWRVDTPGLFPPVGELVAIHARRLRHEVPA